MARLGSFLLPSHFPRAQNEVSALFALALVALMLEEEERAAFCANGQAPCQLVQGTMFHHSELCGDEVGSLDELSHGIEVGRADCRVI